MRGIKSESRAASRRNECAASSESATYGYEPYGQPGGGGWGGPRLRYTGQIEIPEAHLYDDKARAYFPNQGRFLQTDPAGQASDMNLYAYAGEDPINGGDPSGMATVLGDCGPMCTTYYPNGFATLAGAGESTLTATGWYFPLKWIYSPASMSESIPAFSNTMPKIGGIEDFHFNLASIAASPQSNQIPKYCSSLGYEVSDLISGAGEQVQNVSAGVAAGGAVVVATTWYTGAGDVAGGGIAAAGVSGYGFGSALSEVGNFGKFLSGQSGAVTA
ncbi:MAG: RHS repeat-associated core domain-containing protein, partial [Candidatus Dormibacteria bacterium]